MSSCNEVMGKVAFSYDLIYIGLPSYVETTIPNCRYYKNPLCLTASRPDR